MTIRSLFDPITLFLAALCFAMFFGCPNAEAASTSNQPPAQIPLAPAATNVSKPASPEHGVHKQGQNTNPAQNPLLTLVQGLGNNAAQDQAELARVFAIQGEEVDLAPLLLEKNSSLPPPAPQPEATPQEEQANAHKQRVNKKDSAYQERIDVIVRPYNSVTLTNQQAAKVRKVLAFDGDPVSKGQEIILLETGPLEAELALAKSSLAAMASDFAAKTDVSSADRTLMAEKMQKATDEISLLEERLARSTLRAPFAGRITELNACQEQEYPMGTPLVEIAENGLFKLECIAPSRYLPWLQPGTTLEIHIHETQKTYKGRVRRLGGKVDPAKRAVKVYAAFDTDPKGILPGMSGIALIVRPAQ